MKDNKIRVYISLPISGQEDTVKSRFEKAVNAVKDYYCDNRVEICEPVDIKDFDDPAFNHDKIAQHDWAWYMGKDIEQELKCDAIYMCDGYLLSPGCRLELAVARERDMKVIYESGKYHKSIYDKN